MRLRSEMLCWNICTRLRLTPFMSCEFVFCSKSSSFDSRFHDSECSTSDFLCGLPVETRAWCDFRQRKSIFFSTRRVDKCCAPSPNGGEKKHVCRLWSQCILHVGPHGKGERVAVQVMPAVPVLPGGPHVDRAVLEQALDD